MDSPEKPLDDPREASAPAEADTAEPVASEERSAEPEPAEEQPRGPTGGLPLERLQGRSAQTEELVETSKRSAYTLLERQKEKAARGLGAMAHALRETSRTLPDEERQTLAPIADRAAQVVDRFSRTLRERDIETFLDDCKDFARRHPGLFLGGAALAGFLVARFLKSSRQKETVERSPTEEHAA